jgi:hypothetical protein
VSTKPDYSGVYEVAKVAVDLGCKPRWIEDKLRAGLFPGHKVGRRWVLTDDDVEEILRLCAVPTKAKQLLDVIAAAPQDGSSMTVTTARRIRRGCKASPRVEATS